MEGSMNSQGKKSYAGGGAAWALIGAFVFGCLLGAVIVAPMIARMVAR